MLLSASEGLKASNFKGVSSKPVRKGKQHLKFPLYLDHHIGIKESPEISVRFNLINQTADEDYATDSEILRRTVNTCQRDCLATLKQIQLKPFSFQETLHNYKYRKFAVVRAKSL